VGNTMRRNTEALVSGGAAGSSVEAAVMAVERGCGVVWPEHMSQLRLSRAAYGEV
jgi:hypothetical protein